MRKHAFTLVELLVVVTIIVLLIAILLPSLSKTRQLAQRTMCASNLKQNGVALILYTMTYNRFPVAYTELNPGGYSYDTLADSVTGWDLRQQMDQEYSHNFRTLLCPCVPNRFDPNDFKNLPIPLDGIKWVLGNYTCFFGKAQLSASGPQPKFLLTPSDRGWEDTDGNLHTVLMSDYLLAYYDTGSPTYLTNHTRDAIWGAYNGDAPFSFRGGQVWYTRGAFLGDNGSDKLNANVLMLDGSVRSGTKPELSPAPVRSGGIPWDCYMPPN